MYQESSEEEEEEFELNGKKQKSLETSDQNTHEVSQEFCEDSNINIVIRYGMGKYKTSVAPATETVLDLKKKIRTLNEGRLSQKPSNQILTYKTPGNTVTLEDAELLSSYGIGQDSEIVLKRKVT